MDRILNFANALVKGLGYFKPLISINLLHAAITYDFEVIWIGEFKNDQPWNVTSYDKDGNIVRKYVNGKHTPCY